MPKFEFRLQRVLDYREMQEGWAKDAYIEARAARLEADATVATLAQRRTDALAASPTTLSDRQALDSYVQQIDEEIRTNRHVIAILEEEEAKALVQWQERKRELEAMNKLREHALFEFNQDASRQEQKDLDDWTVMRRSA